MITYTIEAKKGREIMIDIYSFLYKYITCGDIEIYDFRTEKIIFAGDPREAMDEYGDYEVVNFDIEPNGKLIVNIMIDD